MNQILHWGAGDLYHLPAGAQTWSGARTGKLFGTADIDEETNKLISETIKAVNYLSRRKIGALMSSSGRRA